MSTTINSKEVSAFSAYNSSKIIEAEATSRNKNTSNTKISKDSKNTKNLKQSKNTSTPANKRKMASVNKSKNKSKSFSLPNLNGTIKSQIKKSKKISSKKLDMSGKSRNKGRLSNSSKTKTSQGSKGYSSINPNEIDKLAEELLAVDARKLTKEQRKKRHELENYLIKQLENNNDWNQPLSEEESCYSDEFSDEYTLNGSSMYSQEADSFCENESCKSYHNQDDLMETQSASSAVKGSSSASNTSSKGKRRNEEVAYSNDECMTDSLVNSNLNKKAKSSLVQKVEDQKTPLNKGIRTLTKKSKNEIPTEKTSQENTDKTSPTDSSSLPIKNLKVEPSSPFKHFVRINSIEEGGKAFQWLINSIKIEDFFSKYWEKKACLVRRDQPKYYAHLISFAAIDQMLLNHHVEFTKNLDITSYKNGVRENHNPEGRALPPLVWHHYSNGCSIRLLNPQTFLPRIYSLSATLQEYFHCLVGANVYLTPPNTQGFAPHYDDIEAFVLQIEGRKRWKLYKPRNAAEVLPRYSSENFHQNDIGKPIMDEILKPGDMLYFPRGTIHQASAEAGHHSLHITLSVYQRQTYADLLEQMLPTMLQKAIANKLDLRRGLPLQCWQHVGVAYKDSTTPERANIQKQVQKLMKKCMGSLPLTEVIDSAFDQLAKRFQHEALPPEISPVERERTIFGSRTLTSEQGECLADYEIDQTTTVRLLRANILRLVNENDNFRLYYYMDNSKAFCEYEANFIDIDSLQAGCVEMLINSYPEYIKVEQLPIEDNEQKIDFVTALWERGLLMMEYPLKCF